MAVGREADAHAVPAESVPGPNAALADPPSEVSIRFTERVEARASSLEVLDAHGRRADRGDASVDAKDPWRFRVTLPALGFGSYTVSWRVLSADDGHVTGGAYVFSIGAATPGQGPTPRVTAGGGLGRWLARWLGVVGGAVLAGSVLARSLLGVRRGALTAGWLLTGGALVLAGGGADLILQARELAGAGSVAGVLPRLLGTPSGRVWLLRLLLLGLLAVWAWAERTARMRGGIGPLGAVLAAAVVVAGAPVSHAAAVIGGRSVALAAQGLHLLAMAAWVGGLIAFGGLFWHAGRAGSVAGSAAARTVALAIARFSLIAVAAVGILTASGIVLAGAHLPHWSVLATAPYGRWLAAKLAVLVGMLALGAYHQRVVQPGLLAAVEAGDGGTAIVARFCRSVRLEAGLGVAALLLAAILGATPPPRAGEGEAPPAFRHERALDGARLSLDVTPLRPGPNAIRLTVTDPGGRPLADATAALVQWVPVAGGVGPVTVSLARVAPGVFAAPAAVLGLVGRWDVRLVVQRAGAYDLNDRLELVVGEGPPAAPTASTSVMPSVDPATIWVALGILAIAGALFLRCRRQLAAVRRFLADTPSPPAPSPARR